MADIRRSTLPPQVIDSDLNHKRTDLDYLNRILNGAGIPAFGFNVKQLPDFVREYRQLKIVCKLWRSRYHG